jgi:phage terminase large subunit GpA-like protein
MSLTPAQQLVNRITRQVRPPEHVTCAEWSRRGRYLSRESSAAPGRFEPKSFQVEPLDAFTDSSVREIVICSAVQLLKTEVILNALGYVIAVDPAPCLVIEPRDSDCEVFSRERLAPMLRDSPELRDKVGDASTATLLHKPFIGGFVDISSAGSAPNLKARPIRFLFLDEIDSYPRSAGQDGDPIGLARKRLGTFHNAKVILCSSPTVAGESVIQAAYDASDMRKFEVPCPSCGEYQVLQWRLVKFDKHGTDQARAASARYVCESCGEPWNDLSCHRAVEKGRWRASAPFHGVAGFWISELYSPWRSLADLVADFLSKRRDPVKLRVFINSSLAEPWRAPGERPPWMDLYQRREHYPIGQVPRGAYFLTAACDVQADRLEVLITGWGPGRECWPIDYRVIAGDPIDVSSRGPWWSDDGLHNLLTHEFPVEGGGIVRILCCAVDSGFRPSPVYQFAQRHPQPDYGPAGSRCRAYGAVAVTKGTDRDDQLLVSVSSIDVARQARMGVRIVHLGTHYGKALIYDLLKLEPVRGEGEAVSYPSGYIHLPNFDASFFRGLVSETRVVRDNGRVDWVEEGGVRNEPLDLMVLSFSASLIAGIDRLTPSDWEKLKVLAAPPPAVPNPNQPTPPSSPPAASPARPIRARFKL